MLIRKLRLQRGWSQETLAEVSGLSVRTIQRAERGERPSLETLNALASVLDTDVKTLTAEVEMSHQTLSPEETEALEHVRDIKGFYSHAATYAVVIAALFVIWLLSGVSHPWFLWPALGWGVGLASHGLAVFEVFSLFSAEWEQRQVQKRLERKRR